MKNVIGLMKDELSGRTIIGFAELLTKTYSYLTDDSDEDKNTKSTKMRVMKQKFEFEDYKYCFEATQLENEINQLEKNKLNVDSLRENHKEFIKNNKLVLQSQQRFRSKKHNVFTEIALGANDEKRTQSIDSIEIYGYRMSKDLVRKKEEIKFNYIIKQYKND